MKSAPPMTDPLKQRVRDVLERLVQQADDWGFFFPTDDCPVTYAKVDERICSAARTLLLELDAEPDHAATPYAWVVATSEDGLTIMWSRDQELAQRAHDRHPTAELIPLYRRYAEPDHAEQLARALERERPMLRQKVAEAILAAQDPDGESEEGWGAWSGMAGIVLDAIAAAFRSRKPESDATYDIRVAHEIEAGSMLEMPPKPESEDEGYDPDREDARGNVPFDRQVDESERPDTALGGAEPQRARAIARKIVAAEQVKCLTDGGGLRWGCIDHIRVGEKEAGETLIDAITAAIETALASPPPVTPEHAELGWAVIEGRIDVRTVSPTRRAAIINWLVVNCGMFISEAASDNDIEVQWQTQSSGRAKVAQVNITTRDNVTPLREAAAVLEGK